MTSKSTTSCELLSLIAQAKEVLDQSNDSIEIDSTFANSWLQCIASSELSEPTLSKWLDKLYQLFQLSESWSESSCTLESDANQDLQKFLKVQLDLTADVIQTDDFTDFPKADALNQVEQSWQAYLDLIDLGHETSGLESDGFESDGFESSALIDCPGAEDELFDWSDDESSFEMDCDGPTDKYANAETQINSLLEILSTEPAETVADNTLVESKIDQQSATHPQDGEPVEYPRELLDDHELAAAFLDDATRCLEAIEVSLIELEEDCDDKEARAQVGRELHTLKGASASVGLDQLATIIHRAEELIEENRPIDADVLTQLFEMVDAIRSQNERLASSSQTRKPARFGESNCRQGDPSQSSHKAPATVNSRSSVGSARASSMLGNDQDSVRIRKSQLDRLMDLLAEMVVMKNRRDSRLDEFSNLVRELNGCAYRLRVASTEWTDYFANHAGAIQPFQKDLNACQPTSFSGSNAVDELVGDISAITRELEEFQLPLMRDQRIIGQFVGQFRRELVKLRRLPVNGLFARLRRSVRDAAREENKQVDVRFAGEDTGLEQSLQEQLFDALVHLVRNAVSHGIENPADRIKARKNETGLVTLSASASASHVKISISDDGQGLNYEAIRKRALDQQLISPGQWLSETELAQLIFHPGFSTNLSASKVSGRGVGMDVVATVIERMFGRIDIHSSPNQGTTFAVTLPLKNGIDHVLMIQENDQLYAIPTAQIASTSECMKRSTHHDGSAASKRIGLSSIFGKTETSQPAASITLENSIDLQADPADGETRDRLNLNFSFDVEKIVSPEEVVVRSLPPILRNHPVFNGATISGDNQIVLMIASNQLTNYTAMRQPAEVDTEKLEVSPSRVETPNVLVVDDSLSARKTLAKAVNAMGLQAHEAGNGKEAIAALENQSFDLIFTDIDMPEMNGFDLIEVIRSENQFSIPIVVVSGRNQTDLLPRLREYSGVHIAKKPIQTNELETIFSKLHISLPARENQ